MIARKVWPVQAKPIVAHSRRHEIILAFRHRQRSVVSISTTWLLLVGGRTWMLMTLSHSR
ncbi:hypothetical protein DCAR_0933785 [Daucus carota subsp. sativus]|uniref:Uncharacterized protein n=1 Tax=Daucus carota subsp. sativus TaxID=79200 RepID=A0A175YEQ9_DAUCS|nr:hypothetical protein DCAR_0933785 [Daucus carota subsp. sativus]